MGEKFVSNMCPLTTCQFITHGAFCGLMDDPEKGCKRLIMYRKVQKEYKTTNK